MARGLGAWPSQPRGRSSSLPRSRPTRLSFPRAPFPASPRVEYRPALSGRPVTPAASCALPAGLHLPAMLQSRGPGDGKGLISKACFASLVSQDYVNGTDQEEIRTGVDQCIQKFLDIARQTECFFLQKRLQLSVQKPEQVIKEDVSELRNELQRKDALVQKHLTKLRHWQQVLEDVSGQHKKPPDIPQGSLAYLEQASANIPAPMKQN